MKMARAIHLRRRLSEFWPVAEPLETRRFFDGAVPLGTVYSVAQAQFQSVEVSLQFIPGGPVTATSGQTITVQTNSTQTVNVFCSHAASTVSVDGSPEPASASSDPNTYDYVGGDPSVDPGTYVTVAAGMHTCVFTILPTSLPEGITQTTADDGITPIYTGPWVVANGVAGGGSIFSSPLPFAITGTNHLAFVQTPTSGVINQTLGTFAVAVENSSNQILDDNDSVITLAPYIGGTIDPTEISGTVTATMVNGVATFNDVAVLGAERIYMYASAGGYQEETEASGEPTGFYDPVGMFNYSSAINITYTGNGGGGSSSLAVAITKSTLPTSVVSGSPAHGNVTVTIDNTGDSKEKSSATVDIFASTDGAIDGSSIQLGSASIKSLQIAAARTKTVPVHITSLPSTLDGSYTLLAQISDAAGNTAVSSTGPALSAAAAFISLVPSAATVALAKNGSAEVSFTLTNEGNVRTASKSVISVNSSADGTVGNSTTVFGENYLPALLPNKPRTLRLRLTAAEVAELRASTISILVVTASTGVSTSLELTGI